jgi:hypothetical protein
MQYINIYVFVVAWIRNLIIDDSGFTVHTSLIKGGCETALSHNGALENDCK